MPKWHLRQPALTYSSCGAFTKNCGKIEKLNYSSYIYKNEWDKGVFTHDAVYAGSKDFVQRTICEKILRDRANETSLTPKLTDIKDDSKKWSRSLLIGKYY